MLKPLSLESTAFVEITGKHRPSSLVTGPFYLFFNLLLRDGICQAESLYKSLHTAACTIILQADRVRVSDDVRT